MEVLGTTEVGQKMCRIFDGPMLYQTGPLKDSPEKPPEAPDSTENSNDS